MTWGEEVAAMRIEARGDLAVFAALLALRKAEGGSAGREFGVLSERAPTYTQQCHIAANSLRHSIDRAMTDGIPVRTSDGFFTDHLLEMFSARWAPRGVANDPHELNANHATNLKHFQARAVLYLVGVLDAVLL